MSSRRFVSRELEKEDGVFLNVLRDYPEKAQRVEVVVLARFIERRIHVHREVPRFAERRAM